MRLATFHVSSIECALPIERLREILEAPPVTRVPGAAAALRGVANLRGQVLPVFDLAVRLGLAPCGADRPCLLVCEAAAGSCALAVDRVHGIEEVREDRVLPPRRDVLGAGDWLAGFLQKDGGLVLVLDVDRLLDPETVRAIRPTVLRPRGARPAPAARPVAPPPAVGSSAAAPMRSTSEASPPAPAPSVTTGSDARHAPAAPSVEAPLPFPAQASSPAAPFRAASRSAGAPARARVASAPPRGLQSPAAGIDVPAPEMPRPLQVVTPAPHASAAPPLRRIPPPVEHARPSAAPVESPAVAATPLSRLPVSGWSIAALALVLAMLGVAIAAITRRDVRRGETGFSERGTAVMRAGAPHAAPPLTARVASSPLVPPPSAARPLAPAPRPSAAAAAIGPRDDTPPTRPGPALAPPPAPAVGAAPPASTASPGR